MHYLALLMACCFDENPIQLRSDLTAICSKSSLQECQMFCNLFDFDRYLWEGCMLGLFAHEQEPVADYVMRRFSSYSAAQKAFLFHNFRQRSWPQLMPVAISHLHSHDVLLVNAPPGFPLRTVGTFAQMYLNSFLGNLAEKSDFFLGNNFLRKNNRI